MWVKFSAWIFLSGFAWRRKKVIVARNLLKMNKTKVRSHSAMIFCSCDFRKLPGLIADVWLRPYLLGRQLCLTVTFSAKDNIWDWQSRHRQIVGLILALMRTFSKQHDHKPIKKDPTFAVRANQQNNCHISWHAGRVKRYYSCPTCHLWNKCRS